MATVRVQAAELHVAESREDVLLRVANAGQGVRIGGARVTPPGWIVLTDKAAPDRQVYLQVAQIGYIHDD